HLLASALGELLDRVFALLDQRGEDLLRLLVVKRRHLVDLAILERGLDHAQGGEALLFASLHGRDHVFLDLVDEGHGRIIGQKLEVRLQRLESLTSALCPLTFSFPLTFPSRTTGFRNILVPMIKKNRLFTPGPTPLLPQAQMAMASYGAHHRTAEFRALFTRVLADVKEFIGTKNDVLVLTSSGTGFMEASVSNLTSPGDRVLVLTAGKFAERWTALVKAFGCAVETVSAPYGQTFSLDEVRRKLTPEIRCVYMQATESSTGARHDVEAIAKLVRVLPDTLFVVDAITGLGTTHLDVDAWGIDVIIGGSQKALMIPPGLAYGAISERAWQRMETTKSPRFYFDLRKERKAAAMARAGVAALGLKLFAPSSPAAALTAVAAPAGIDSTAICKRFREQFGAVVANGNAELKGQLFRIAHIGYYDYLDTVGVLAALEHVIAETTGKEVEFG